MTPHIGARTSIAHLSPGRPDSRRISKKQQGSRIHKIRTRGSLIQHLQAHYVSLGICVRVAFQKGNPYYVPRELAIDGIIERAACAQDGLYTPSAMGVREFQLAPAREGNAVRAELPQREHLL